MQRYCENSARDRCDMIDREVCVAGYATRSIHSEADLTSATSRESPKHYPPSLESHLLFPKRKCLEQREQRCPGQTCDWWIGPGGAGWEPAGRVV